MQERNGWCRDLDRSKFTFPIYEYCHPDYYSDADGEDEFVGDVNICGDRLITGHSVIGKLVTEKYMFVSSRYMWIIGGTPFLCLYQICYRSIPILFYIV